MRIINHGNFKEQAESAETWFAREMCICYHYQQEHPDKIHIIHDEVQLKDPKHYREWRKSLGYG